MTDKEAKISEELAAELSGINDEQPEGEENCQTGVYESSLPGTVEAYPDTVEEFLRKYTYSFNDIEKDFNESFIDNEPSLFTKEDLDRMREDLKAEKLFIPIRIVRDLIKLHFTENPEPLFEVDTEEKKWSRGVN